AIVVCSHMLLTLQAVERATLGDSWFVKVEVVQLKSGLTRERIAFHTGVGAWVAFSLMLGSFLWPAVFVLTLAIWLVFCLCVFHWGFARKKSLTITQVRLIDYVYLG